MKTLNENWFAEGRIDFELKKYTLLSYLQEITLHFRRNKLYPPFADLIFHYRNLVRFKENKNSISQLFPERLSEFNPEDLKFSYEKIINDDELMQEIESIIAFSIDKMDETLAEGREIYEFVEGQLTIEPVGLVPINNDFGYIFICDGNYSDIRVYEYHITLFENSHEKLRGINTTFIGTYLHTFSNTLENIKVDLIKSRNTFFTPAVYSIETNLTFPIEETLLPVAKRSLIRYISSAA